MTINEKQHIAAIARNLIQEFEYCDDDEFIDLIVECVRNSNPFPIYPECLWDKNMEEKINQFEKLLKIKLTRYQKILLISLLENKEIYGTLTGAKYIASLRSEPPIEGRIIK